MLIATRFALSVVSITAVMSMGGGSEAFACGPDFAPNRIHCPYEVAFSPGSLEPTPEMDVDLVAEWLADFPEGYAFQLAGTVCPEDRLRSTSQEELLELAEARAVALRDMVTVKGVDYTRLSTISFGMGRACQVFIEAFPPPPPS